MSKGVDLGAGRGAAEAALLRADELGVNVSVVVCDGYSRDIVVLRGDGASWQSVEIARSKARTAASFGRDSADLAAMRENWPDVFALAGDALPFRATTLPGGLAVIVNGAVVAAIGVSGALPEQDVAIARAGRALLSG